MSKLTGLSINEIQSNRWHIAQEFAQKWGVVLVLKGAMTVVASPKAELFILPVSDSALATAGSGDVLAGVIGGLLAQGTSTPLAAACGVWLHAQAGLAAKTIIGTAHCVTALAILDYLPEAFFKLKTAGMRLPAV
jgi:NAD(P)H-hydrate epimerase